MKLTNAIKKLTTSGFKVTTKGRTLEATKGRQIIGCAIDTEYNEAKRFYTKKAGQESDVRSDYFCETWHDNLTQALESASR